jgi:branched-chain amino acid transport system substrate-binding protein
VVEECEFGYATDKGVECYERVKSKAVAFSPYSTGVTFALTEKAPVDKIPLLTMGYGRSESADGSVFTWNFPILGTYWSAADILLQHVSKKGSLKGKKITLVYHDSPYGKEPIPVLQEQAKKFGYTFEAIPVTHPGVEQKAVWLQIRQSRPDYVFLWGWGVMNSTAIKEAVATGYPRDRMYGVWWASAEPDVIPAAADAKGYNGVTLQHSAGRAKVHEDVLKFLHDKGQGTGPREEVGTVLYTRGLISAMLSVEAVRRAQERYGKKPLTGEQVRWGLENLALDQKRLDALGFAGVMRPISTSCRDHAGSHVGRIHTWDGTKWTVTSDWYEADQQIIRPMIQRSAAAYLSEKKLARRDCAKELSGG